MKKQLKTICLSIVLAAVLVSCGGGKKEGSTADTGSKAETKPTEESSPEGIQMVDQPGENWGNVKGIVTFEGEAPDPVKAPRDSKCGLKEGDPLNRIKIDKEKKVVKNAIVYLDGVKKAIQGKFPPKQITIDQKKCLFEPRWTYVIRTEGTVTVKNSDPELHNFRYQGSSGFGANGNENQAPGADPINIEMNGSEWITFQCNVHPWMQGLMRASEHHAVGISGKNGTFSFSVPPGSYTLKVHHVSLNKPVTQKVTVKKGESVKTNVSISFD